MAYSRKKLLWSLSIILAVVSIAAVLLVVLPRRGDQIPAAQFSPASGQSPAIACLGRIEPEDGVIRVAARSISGQPSIIAELRIKEGDSVKAGQILAVLDSKQQLEAVWLQAQARVKTAQYRLAQVKAGAKAGDIAAQHAEIARLQSELANAQSEYRRYEKLHQKEVVPASSLDPRRLLVETLTSALRQAKERLNSLTEVRQVDIDLAEAEVELATAEVQRTKAELGQAVIYSPIDGRVIKIHARPGEEVSNKGILELGKADQMFVIAEVPESDVGRVRIGQRATVMSDPLGGKIEGIVEHVGLKIAKSEVLPTDPVAFSDTRVVEVKIRLDDSKRVQNLIHAKVTVLIKT